MRTYKMIPGDDRVITILFNHGWKIEGTYPNPYPEPYFYALMYRDHNEDEYYNVDNVLDHVYRDKELNPTKRPLKT